MIFARRQIQQMIDTVCRLVDTRVGAHFVRELNKRRTSLSAEWELVILQALAQIGKIAYESDFHGASRPDITFRSHDGDAAFVADIVSVSDSGLLEENPTDHFVQIILRFATDLGLNPNGIAWQIDGAPTGVNYRNRKMKLHLPPSNELEVFLGSRVLPQMSSASTDGKREFIVRIDEPGAKFTINYRADRNGGSGGHPSYDVAYSLTRNPLHWAIKRKIEQLAKAQYEEGPMGIFVCDGGCHLMKSKMRSHSTYSEEQVVTASMEGNDSIAFIMMVWVESAWPAPTQPRYQVRTKVYRNPIAKRALTPPLELLLLTLHERIPLPRSDADNALRWIRSGKEVPASLHGGHELSHGRDHLEIKLSSRHLVELLAGQETQTAFLDRLGFRQQGPMGPGEMLNPFAEAISRGLMVEEIKIERQTSLDDDWVVIRFGGPDPALARYRTGGSASKLV